MMKPIELIAFEVEGRPVTQGSKRAWVNQGTGKVMMVEDRDVELTSWRREVKQAAQRALVGAKMFAPTTDPLRVLVTFFFRRPGNHYGSGKNSLNLKPSASPYPHGRIGDVDKLTRAILDSMTDARVFVDDSQVVDLLARKRWADRLTGKEGVTVDVYAMREE